MHPDKELKKLLSLLDDADESVGGAVLSVLLDKHFELMPYLAELQDSTDPVVRRRVQQLQSILLVRERRHSLLEKINKSTTLLSTLLCELHLQWFDCDAYGDIQDIYRTFAEDFKKRNFSGFEQVAGYMISQRFTVEPDTSLDPELYCIGPVVSWQRGASSLVCMILKELLEDNIPDLQIIRSGEKFMLCDGRNILSPVDFWQVSPLSEKEDYAVWDNRKCALFALSMLFSYSVSHDHFRYVYTVGQALCGSSDDTFLSALPYPYRHLPEEIYEEQNRSKTMK